MIQRIQTLYLFLVALLTGLMFAFPLVRFLNGAEEMLLDPLGFKDAVTGELILNAYGLAATTIVAILLPLVTIFLFKKRLIQFRLCIVELVFLAGTLIFEVYYIWGGLSSIGADTSTMLLSVTAFFPLISAIFTLLALRGIKKDILLVKSLDRIR